MQDPNKVVNAILFRPHHDWCVVNILANNLLGVTLGKDNAFKVAKS